MTTFRIGELEIIRVEDFVDHGVPLTLLFPEVSEEAIAANHHWLQPRFLDPGADTTSVHIQSWVIRTQHQTIMVDTCVGHQKKRHFPPFNLRDSVYLDNLRAAGVHPEEVDYVFCTHLHSDLILVCLGLGCSPRDFLTRRLAADLISASDAFKAPQCLAQDGHRFQQRFQFSPDSMVLQRRGWIIGTEQKCPAGVEPPPCWDVALTPLGVEMVRPLISNPIPNSGPTIQVATPRVT